MQKSVKKSIHTTTVSILGIAYKPNVKDAQSSPVIEIIQKLKQLKVKIKIYDPYFEDENFMSIRTEKNIIDCVKNSNAVIIITAHDKFLKLETTTLNSHMKTPILLDTRGIVNAKKAKSQGWIYKGLGRA